MAVKLRLLPMGKVLFSDYEEVIHFLNDGLRKGGGRYYYRRKSIVFEEDLTILFQFGGAIVASATMIGQSDEGMVEDGVLYKGFYLFDMNTMKVFDTPIIAEQIRGYMPEFRGFNQSTQRLTEACLGLFQ